jgi:regulator of replication initiation timing
MNLVAKAKEEEVAILSTQVNDMKKRVLEVFEENVLVKQQVKSMK